MFHQPKMLNQPKMFNQPKKLNQPSNEKIKLLNIGHPSSPLLNNSLYRIIQKISKPTWKMQSNSDSHLSVLFRSSPAKSLENFGSPTQSVESLYNLRWLQTIPSVNNGKWNGVTYSIICQVTSGSALIHFFYAPRFEQSESSGRQAAAEEDFESPTQSVEFLYDIRWIDDIIQPARWER